MDSDFWVFGEVGFRLVLFAFSREALRRLLSLTLGSRLA